MSETNFYIRIRMICREQHRSLSDACREAGLASNEHKRWKNGLVPSEATLEALATVLDVEPGYLVGGVKGYHGNGPQDRAMYALAYTIGGMTPSKAKSYLGSLLEQRRAKGMN